MEVPNLDEAHARFDEWLMSDPGPGEITKDIMVKQALGLKT